MKPELTEQEKVENASSIIGFWCLHFWHGCHCLLQSGLPGTKVYFIPSLMPLLPQRPLASWGHNGG